MKRVLVLIVLLAVGLLFVGCSHHETAMAPVGDAPENPQESGGKYTPEEMDGQTGTTSDTPADLPQVVAE